MQYLRPPSYIKLRVWNGESVKKNKTKQNQNRKEIKALHVFFYYYFFSVAENFIDSLSSLFPSKMSLFFLHFEDIHSVWSSGMAPWAESCQQAQSAAMQTRPTSKLSTCLRKLSQGEPFLSPLLSPSIFLWRSPFSTVFISESYKSAPKLG